MCRALIADQRMGGIILSRGRDSLSAERDIVAARCGPAAAEGHVNAALALVLTEADTTAVVPLARRCLDALAQPRTHTPGHYEFSGGWQDEAVLSIALTSAVRRTLAAHLPDGSAYDQPRAVLLNDVHRSVRTVIRGN